MGWATVASRKAELKNRINTLETRAMEISQEKQTIANQASYDQQEVQLKGNYEQALLNQDYQNAMDAINNDRKASDADKQQSIMKVQTEYNNRMNIFQQTQQAKLNSQKHLTDARTNALEAQQEQIESQLKAARAEYDNLGQAMDQDIKDGAIKLI